MICLNFVSSFKRSYFSSNMWHASFLHEKTIKPLNLNTIALKCTNYARTTALKPVIMTQKGCIFKPFHDIAEKSTVVKIHSFKNFEHFRCFRTSERRYLHPVLWVFLNPVLKLFAVLSGRGFRKWWKDLPPNKKKYFWNIMKENKNRIGIFALASCLLSVIYYISHLEDTPVTGRKRFIAFNAKQLEKINEYEFQNLMEQLKGQILPARHPYTLRVQFVVNRILNANRDIEEVKKKKWGISVIDSSMENAFVLPIGHVFVFTGMLNLCSNDDQLGIILSHEIAHCIQNHGAENVSFTHLLDLISILMIAAIWAIVPSDSISILMHWLYNKLSAILFKLPYNRKIETEADDVGLQLAAKACFDVRESSAFWSKMAILKKNIGKVSNIEFLSTHPSHEKRSEYLDGIMDKAVKLRVECGCPNLKQKDPRTEVEVMTKALEITRQKYLQQHPKPVYTFHL